MCRVLRHLARAATTIGGEGRQSEQARGGEGPWSSRSRPSTVEVKARYGSPQRSTPSWSPGTMACCVNTVARLMWREGIVAKTKRKSRGTTDSNHDRPVAENVRNRQFGPKAEDRARTTGITDIATAEAWLSPAARGGPRLAKDRRLVDGAADRQPTGRRCPGDGGLAAPAGRGPRGAFGPREPVCRRALPASPATGSSAA